MLQIRAGNLKTIGRLFLMFLQNARKYGMSRSSRAAVVKGWNTFLPGPIMQEPIITIAQEFLILIAGLM